MGFRGRAGKKDIDIFGYFRRNDRVTFFVGQEVVLLRYVLLDSLGLVYSRFGPLLLLECLV